METVYIARVKYTKTGMLRFIGHLDTARMLSRALRASGLPISYSQGFNPHPKLAFGPPLPLGFSSECEYFDIELTGKKSPQEIETALASHLPEGVAVVKVAALSYRPTSLTKIIDHVLYRVTLPMEHYTTPENIESVLKNEQHEKRVSFIERLSCSKKDDTTCEYEITLKNVSHGAPSVKKIFAELLEKDIFKIDGVKLHREKQWSVKSRIF